ncbi:GntR family transcriptional regulator [Sedimenticola thiotaurini]|nr:GntR family transcriptional regulator [Sedimenticola thiotaurini]
MDSYSLERPTEFVRRYWPPDPNLPKHEQLRRALTQSIMEGFWKVGARLPTEADLVATTPCGLATVQRALRELVADGIIERRRGSGSVVADLNGPIEEPWHMRFLDPTKGNTAYLPLFTEVLDRHILEEQGPWTNAIESGTNPVVRIDRIFTVNNDCRIYSIFYAIASRFPELIELPVAALGGKNLKTFIARRYHVPVHKVKQKLRYVIPPAEVVEHGDCPAGFPATLFNVIAYGLNGEPMYYQDFYIPPTDYELDLGITTK